jgi:hypothetical protein
MTKKSVGVPCMNPVFPYLISKLNVLKAIKSDSLNLNHTYVEPNVTEFIIQTLI